MKHTLTQAHHTSATVLDGFNSRHHAAFFNNKRKLPRFASFPKAVSKTPPTTLSDGSSSHKNKTLLFLHNKFDGKALVSAIAAVDSFFASSRFFRLRRMVDDVIFKEVTDFLLSTLRKLAQQTSDELTIVVEEFDGYLTNQVFEAVQTYLGTKIAPSISRLKVSKAEGDTKLGIKVAEGVDLFDVYEDVKVKWSLFIVKPESHREGSQRQGSWYELSFHKKQKNMVLDSYLPYILDRAKAIKEETRDLKLYRVDYYDWTSGELTLTHPMTFDTLAIDLELKKAFLDDLNAFVNGKDFYKRIGRAWKRGYLLYGPPGTGKSSLIAAMANYLKYDIYDLDLSEVESNYALRRLLLGLSNRSILVIEDIDCSIRLQNRSMEEQLNTNKMTLSGLLNFVDGLWSCCSTEERIIVITTNFKDKLDPALLRPGRMDMHIQLSYCTFSAFKQLAFNYLQIYDHILFEQIKTLIQKTEVTPAEVAEELMKSIHPEVSLQGVVKFLQNKEEKRQKDHSQQDKVETRKEKARKKKKKK